MIKVKANIGGVDTWQSRHVSTQTSAMGGQNSSKLVFGLKDASSIDSLVVLWPSGVVTTPLAPAINQILTVNEPYGSRICGTVFYDVDGDGIQDAEEIGIPNMNLVVTTDNYEIFTDANGNYSFYSDDGTITITQWADANYTQTFPAFSAGYRIVVDQASESVYCGNDFGNDAVCENPDLTVSFGCAAFRRGFENMLNVLITNQGAGPARVLRNRQHERTVQFV